MRYKRIAGDKPRKVLPTSCGRCAGSGLYSQRHGQCYRCGGTGEDPSYKAWGYPAAWTDAQCEAAHNAREKKNEAARARRREKKENEIAAQWAANVEACPALQVAEDEKMTHLGIHEIDALRSIQSTAKKYGLSEKQIEYAGVLVARNAERAERAAAESAEYVLPPEGRHEITGEIIKTEWKDNEWGGGTKILIKCEKYKLYGSLPSGYDHEEVEPGKTITFKATIKAKEAGFGFYSRPKKIR